MAQPNSVTPLYPSSAFALTKSDTDQFPPSHIYVGGTGDVAVQPAQPEGATAVVFKAVPTGAVIPCLCVRVMSTNTTATNLVRIA